MINDIQIIIILLKRLFRHGDPIQHTIFNDIFYCKCKDIKLKRVLLFSFLRVKATLQCTNRQICIELEVVPPVFN